MKLEQFEQVLEILKTGSFSQAARNLYMSQPNLSLSIKQLEKELGCRLFERSAGHILPTPESQDLIEHMARIHSHYEMLLQYSRREDGGRISLRIATINLSHSIPFFIESAARNMDKPIRFSHFNCMTVDDVIDRVATCQADIGIIGCMEPYLKNMCARLENRQLEYHPLTENPVYAAMGEKNPYYGTRDSLVMEDLRDQTVLTYGNEAIDPNSGIYNFVELSVASRGRISVNNNYLFYELLHETSAIGLVSFGKSRIYHLKYWPELRFIPIKDYPVVTAVGWIKLARMPLPETASEMIDALSKAY